MNIKEYISSGIVESYVLGLASEQERAEFEQLCLQYPELVTARNDFEEKLERQAFENAITAPAFVKEKVLSTIQGQSIAGREAKIIAMNRVQKSNSWLKYVAAASVLLLLASAYFGYDLYSKNEKLRQSTNQMQASLDSTNKQMDELKRMMDITTNHNVTVVSLVGTEKKSFANIYWDTASRDVYMFVKNMPQLPTEKQYQLWAFIDGKPVDLGLFDIDKRNFFLRMKNTQRAEAFAITIEQRGNGPEPHGTLESMKKL